MQTFHIQLQIQQCLLRSNYENNLQMSSEEKTEMELQLTDLSYPFTWEMNEVIGWQQSLLSMEAEQNHKVTGNADDIPLGHLMYHLMMAFEFTKKRELINALKELKEADDMLATIQKKLPGDIADTIKAVEHVVEATKCHVLYEMGRFGDVKMTLKEIKPVTEMTKQEEGTLCGLRSLAWSQYQRAENMKAINFARCAISLNPGNSTWYFILAENLRRVRRHASLELRPTKEEFDSYQKALELSENPTYAISIAQLYRENNDKAKALEMYQAALALNPECCLLRLRLALGFIRTRRNDLARRCLDYVSEKMPEGSMYLHYEGIYYEKCERNYQTALKFYKGAADLYTSAAEIQYVLCRRKVEPKWDPLPYFLDMLKRYKGSGGAIDQKNILHIGSCYFDLKQDYVNACKYFLEAIKIDPQDKILKTYTHCLREFDFVPVNIYNLLENHICPILKSKCDVDQATSTMIDEALKICKDNSTAGADIDPLFDNIFAKLKLG